MLPLHGAGVKQGFEVNHGVIAFQLEQGESWLTTFKARDYIGAKRSQVGFLIDFGMLARNSFPDIVRRVAWPLVGHVFGPEAGALGSDYSHRSS